MMEKYVLDATEKKHIENSRIPFAIYQFVDKHVVTLALSAGFCELFGYKDYETAYYDMDNDMYKDTHEDDIARIADAAYRFATEGGKYEVVYRTKLKSSDVYIMIHAMGEHIYTDEGVRLAQVWYVDEGICPEDDKPVAALNSSMKNALYEESLKRASYYDHLTGLPGMTYFFELAAAKRDDIIANGGRPALLYMDFSGMKYFNHKYGFEDGDILLRGFSRILAEHFGSECCSRLGQDHFAAITENDNLELKLEAVFEECQKLNNGRSLPVHVGIYQHWFDGIVTSMACDRAKFACDTLKNIYSSGYSYYDMTMKDTEERQQYIITNLDKAIEEKWIKVYYQPIIRSVNGRVCDEEALARWIDPVNGFMSPGEFIPVLEDHKLIYKLDLFVVDCVLQKIKTMSEAGLDIMPQSVNLSRSDFDTCDIVQEICRRMDTAGIEHSMLNIEITESVIGEDFDFMKKQIERFKKLGFSIWMDDFGSGYSSLDALQSIPFDLLKFDMRFMQRFNESPAGGIMLTELLRMATSLGLDTVCEGVETEEQVTFLKETGCSKLQGYFFEKPIPVEKILEKYANGRQIGFEDPIQSDYYDAIGRVSLHDISEISQGASTTFDKYFDAMPMAIIEVLNDQVRFARTNRSYREFIKRAFGIPLGDKIDIFREKPETSAMSFMKGLMNCTKSDEIIFMNEQFPDGTNVHSCARRIAVNPNGTVAILVAVLSAVGSNKGTTYANIASALAADYFNLFYVNIETETFFEYTSAIGGEDMAMERKAEDFFNQSRKDALKFLYEEDCDKFVAEFRKENILRKLDEQGTFTLTYRLMMDGEPVYVNMKAVRPPNDLNHLIIGVSNVDQAMKQKILLERVHRNEEIFSRLMALSGDYLCLYNVDPETDDYTEFTADSTYNGYGFAKEGKKFFEQAIADSEAVLPEDDRKLLAENFTKENVLSTIEKDSIFKLGYHLITDDGLLPVMLRAALVREEDGEKLIIGVQKHDTEDN